MRFRPHGISLLKRKDGAVQIFAVNHGGRESIEMFELKQYGGTFDPDLARLRRLEAGV